jgi:hypothetical protein
LGTACAVLWLLLAEGPSGWARQWSSFDQQQNNISRQRQGFSNYLLDQSAAQNNNVGGTGMVGHATMWDSTADALVKANPNRTEFVNTPNYWQGTHFQP